MTRVWITGVSFWYMKIKFAFTSKSVSLHFYYSFLNLSLLTRERYVSQTAQEISTGISPSRITSSRTPRYLPDLAWSVELEQRICVS